MKKKCNCSLATKLVGDGCEVCNPNLSIEFLIDSFDILEARVLELEVTIEQLKTQISSLEERI